MPTSGRLRRRAISSHMLINRGWISESGTGSSLDLRASIRLLVSCIISPFGMIERRFTLYFSSISTSRSSDEKSILRTSASNVLSPSPTTAAGKRFTTKICFLLMIVARYKMASETYFSTIKTGVYFMTAGSERETFPIVHDKHMLAQRSLPRFYNHWVSQFFCEFYRRFFLKPPKSFSFRDGIAELLEYFFHPPLIVHNRRIVIDDGKAINYPLSAIDIHSEIIEISRWTLKYFEFYSAHTSTLDKKRRHRVHLLKRKSSFPVHHPEQNEEIYYYLVSDKGSDIGEKWKQALRYCGE